MGDQNEYAGPGGSITHSAARDPEAGDRGQSALDAEAQDRKRASMIAAKEGSTTSDDDPEPKAAQFGGDLGKWSAARSAWMQRKSNKNPQAAAVKGMLKKTAGAEAAQ